MLLHVHSADTRDRVHLLLCRGSGWCVFFPAWVRSCSSASQRFKSLLMTLS